MKIFLYLKEKASLLSDNFWKVAVLCLTAMICSLMLTTLIAELLNPIPLQQGEVAKTTVRSPRDFLIEDTLSTEKRRSEAELKVPAVFTIDDSARDNVSVRLGTIFAAIKELPKDNTAEATEEVNREESDSLREARSNFERQYKIDLVGEEWQVIANPQNWEKLEQSVKQLVLPLLEQGIIGSKRPLKNFIQQKRPVVARRLPLNTQFIIDSTTDLLTPLEAELLLNSNIPHQGFGYGKAFDSLTKKLSMLFLKPNATFDAAETNARASEARTAVEPIYFRTKRNEVIVRAGDVISLSQETRLRRLSQELDSGNRLREWAGYLILCFIVILGSYYFTSVFWPGCNPTARDLSIGAITLTGSLLLIKAFSLVAVSLSNTFFFFEPGTFLLAAPVAAGGILLQVTLGAPFVLMFVLTFSFVTGIFLENSWLVLLLIVVGNIVGALAVRNCSRRSAFIFAGIRVAAVNLLLVLCFQLLFPEDSTAQVANRLIWAVTGGILSGVLGAGLTPIAEFIGGYVTDIKLLELASLDHPLLRELSVQAPGTWNHSVVLGQIGEAAAESIGANALLTRVGAYYHDIGKIKKPAYFVENQTKENRHDKLTPSMSALIIKTHVKDGMEIARQHNLPRPIVEFIPQHHGTSLIRFFFEKALSEAEEGDTVEENHYRYGGPKPQSKEAAILMLGDAVEASSRTLPDPSPTKLQGLVQKIINGVFTSGELDESTLTLKDLHMIAKSFVRVLTGIYHRRINYPDPVEKNKKTAKAQASTAGVEKPKEGEKGVENGSGDADKTNGSGKADETPPKRGAPGESSDALKRLGM